MAIDLTGKWESSDYECPAGTKHREVVSIKHVGEGIKAIKVTGDPCVPAGFETFSGRLPEGTSVAAITWTGGLPRAPASGTFPGFLEGIDANMFRAGSVASGDQTFVRKE